MNEIFDRTKKQLNERNQTLQKLKKILDSLKITFFLEGGVLLGSVRNKNFIKWDHDVELGVFREKFSKKKILDILHKIHDQELTIDFVDSSTDNFKINLHEHNHTKFSIIGFKKENGYMSRHMVKYPSNFFYPLNNISFLGKNYKIPNNVEDLLRWIYGDWKKEVRSRDINIYMTDKSLNSKFYTYLKKIKPRIKSFFKMKIHQFKSKDFIHKREFLFRYMINSNNNKKNVLFFDIGSNDGIESIEFLKNNRLGKSIIIEPDKNNIKVIKKNLSKNYIDKKKFKIFNVAISSKNYNGYFYLNKKSSNLNSSIYNPLSNKVKIQYKVLKDFLIKFNNNNHLILKMDLEGDEVNVLKGSIKYLCKVKNISIILELHPLKYKKKEMYKIFKEFFKNGYKVKFVESAFNRSSCEFEKNGLIPFKVAGARKLFNNVDKNFILKNALTPNFGLKDFNPGFSFKIVRSIMIEKLNEK